MKAKLFDSSGKEKSEVQLPKIFDTRIREDITQKYFEVYKLMARQLYSPFEMAGRQHSASGTISHRRHKWKGHYGKGISRIPRKKMWRRGTQFFWIGAEVNMARGGRSVHAPSGVRTPLKMNKKEVEIAMNSAFAATANKEFVTERYSTLSDVKSAPFVVESLPAKTKALFAMLQSILGSSFSVALQNKQVRASGAGRGRKYKSNAGVLIVKGKSEKAKFSGVEVKAADEVEITDLFPLGRLTVYTKKALEELEAAK